MGNKKTRQKKVDPRTVREAGEGPRKKEKDWSFEDIARSKSHRH